MKWLCICSILLSCTTNKHIIEKISGTYQSADNYNINSSIEILPDKTFKYQWFADMAQGYTTGKWHYKKGYIILNSYKQPNNQNTDEYEVLEELAKKEKAVTIKVVDSYNNPIPFVDCKLITHDNKEQVGITTRNGICHFENLYAIKKIILASIGFKTVEYAPKDSINYIKVLMKEENKNYVFFINKKLKVKKNKLIIKKDGEKQIYQKLK